MNIEKVARVKFGVKQDMGYARKNTDSNKAQSEPNLSNRKFNDDTVSISDEARALLAEDGKLNPYAEKAREVAEILRRLEEAPDPADNPYMDKIKCLQIAMRIMNGDHVPTKDRQFLLENEPEMYSKALLLRRNNNDPKKYKSLIADKKDEAATNRPSPASFEGTAQGASESTSEESSSSDSVDVSAE